MGWVARRRVGLVAALSALLALGTAVVLRTPANAAGGGAPTSTITTVTASPNPGFAGSAIRLTATLATADGSPGTPNGTITFKEGATVLGAVALVTGTASLDVSTFTPGTHVVTGAFTTTDTAYRESSGTVTVTVDTATVQTGTTFCNPGGIAISSSSTVPYPSRISVSGTSGTLSKLTLRLAGLSASTTNELDLLLVGPGGQKLVPLSAVGGTGSVSAATITLDDSAGNSVPATSSLTSGTFRPTAGSATGVTFPAPAPAGPHAFAAPTGSASFSSTFNGLSPNGTWSLYAISRDTSTATPAQLTGGWCLDATTAAASVATTTSLAASANPSLVGDPVTFTATVTAAGSPVTTGTVTFKDGATTLASAVALNASGQATMTTSALTEGTHTIQATYSGASGFGVSSASLTQTVDRATTATGNVFCNTGTITIPTSGSTTPYPSRIFSTGLSGTTRSVFLELNSVSFPVPQDIDLLLVRDGAQAFVPFSHVGGSTPSTATITLGDNASSGIPAAVPLASGFFRPTAVDATGLTFAAPAPGATYALPAPSGFETFATAFENTSPNATWSLYAVSRTTGATTPSTIGGWCVGVITSFGAATTTTVSVTPTPSATGAVARVSATVTNASDGTPATGGTVTFRDGSAFVASGPIINGVATFTTTLSEGAHLFAARYSGATGYLASRGQALHYVDSATTNPAAGRFCNSAAVSTAATSDTGASPYPTRINVSGLSGTTSKVTVELNGYSQPLPGAIDMMVTGPNGRSLVVMSGVGGSTAVSSANLVLDSTAANQLPSAALASGTYRPADYDAATGFPAPAPTANVFSGASTTLGTAFNTSNPNGIWSLWIKTDAGGSTGTGALANGWCVNVTTNQPQLTVSKSHTGDFSQGQTGAQYTITAGNSGPGTVLGPVTVVDTLPVGLTLTGLAGSGWTCTVATRTCTRSDALAAGSTYPPITATVDVAVDAPALVRNDATVSSPGSTSATASDPTTVIVVAPQAPDLTIAKSTASTFIQGGTATYDLVATNIGNKLTTAVVTVSDTMPTGLTIALPVTAGGWDCSTSTTTQLTCTSTGALNPNDSRPIHVPVNIATNAPTNITNTATVSGGGETKTDNNSASATVTVALLPSLQRLYDNSVVPPSSIAIGTQYAVETAQRINFSCAGSVSGVWWYRTPSDVGLNTVSVWRGTTLVAQAAANPGATGWVKIAISPAVTVASGDQLLLGVHHPNGAYGYRLNGFTNRSVASGCLTSPASSAADKNGRYAYSPSAVLPTLSYADSEYFISPEFQPGSTPPPPPPPPPTSQRLYAASVTPPSTLAIGSTWAVETAQRINFACKGTVKGVWWYRTAQDTGVNTVTAWRNGVQVGSGSGNPGGTGWQFLAFTSPVTVSVGDQLLLGVHHPNGAYGYFLNGFSGRSVTSGCLTSPATTATAPNGMYTYSATPVLPTLTYAASEYFISPDFTEG